MQMSIHYAIDLYISVTQVIYTYAVTHVIYTLRNRHIRIKYTTYTYQRYCCNTCNLYITQLAYTYQIYVVYRLRVLQQYDAEVNCVMYVYIFIYVYICMKYVCI